MIHGVDAADVSEKDKRQFLKKAWEIVGAGSKVFGQMTVMHTCVNPKHHYLAAPVSHPLLLLPIDLAGGTGTHPQASPKSCAAKSDESRRIDF